IFGEREVLDAEYPRQRGDHASCLAPEELVVAVHLELHERTDLDRPAVLEDRAALGKLNRLTDCGRPKQHIGIDQVLGFGIGAVMDVLAVAPHHLARTVKRISGIFDNALFAEILEPSDPLLHGLLHLTGRARLEVTTTK